MKRFLAPLALFLVAATATHAQTVTRTYTTSDGFGNSTTTTVEAPASVAGLVAGQTVYGGFPSYAGGVPSYGTNYPNYNGGYGYNYNYGYPNPYGYYGPQAYFIPGTTTPLGQSRYSWAPPPTVTTLPQFVVPNGVPYYPGYGYPGYGYSTSTTVVGGSLNYQTGGVGLSIGGTSTNTKTPRPNPPRRGFGNRIIR